MTSAKFNFHSTCDQYSPSLLGLPLGQASSTLNVGTGASKRINCTTLLSRVTDLPTVQQTGGFEHLGQHPLLSFAQVFKNYVQQ